MGKATGKRAQRRAVLSSDDDEQGDAEDDEDSGSSSSESESEDASDSEFEASEVMPPAGWEGESGERGARVRDGGWQRGKSTTQEASARGTKFKTLGPLSTLTPPSHTHNTVRFIRRRRR